MDSKDSAHEATFEEHSSTLKRPLLPLAEKDAVSEKKASGLPFLDGLRGIAALIVYQHHHISEYYGGDGDLMHAYGYQERYHFGQWRFIQLFFAGGTPAVMLFFVLSGYVLSKGPLQMLQSGKQTLSIQKYLLNALLRRPLRLWLPPILVSLPVAVAFHTPLRPVGAYIIYQPNLFSELWTWLTSLVETVSPFIGHGPFLQSFGYDPPVWTMAYELNGSVLVYAWIAVCGPFLSVRQRMYALAVTLFVSFEYGHFSLVPFVLGMMLAQMDVASLDQPGLERVSEKRRPLVLNAIFIFGWYLLSDVGPLVKSEHPWFGLPDSWIPFPFYHNTFLAINIIGATCMVYAALRLPWLQHLLNRAKWLGRVSFALYLTHVPVLWILGYRVSRCFGAKMGVVEGTAFFDNMLPIPDVGPLGLSTRYLAMQLIILPLNLMLAEVVTVWIDETSVTVSKQFAAKIMQRLHI